MESNNRVTYFADIVFCIDATGSMGKVIEMVKQNALSFRQDLAKAMKAKGKTIQQLRIRVIAFRDYIADGENAMMATDFFLLPEEVETFSKCVNGIQATGGGDIPEDGLEALAFAIRSKWTMEAAKKRHVIVLWTDAGVHELGYGSKMSNYPEKMAKNFEELTNWWGDEQLSGYMDFSAKRLLLFAPYASYWKTISDNWDNVMHYPSVAGAGLKEIDYNQIIDAISNSI